MENELKILNTIEKSGRVTQREIASHTGMSLGSVNILINRLIKKGLLKIERLNPRTIRYILTPHGLKEKAEATYRYVVSSYRYINEIESKLDIAFKSGFFDRKNKVCLFGEQDELRDIIINKLNHSGLSYIQLKSKHELDAWFNSSKTEERLTVVVWQPDRAEYLKEKNVEYVNLLDSV